MMLMDLRNRIEKESKKKRRNGACTGNMEGGSHGHLSLHVQGSLSLVFRSIPIVLVLNVVHGSEE